MLVLHWQLCQVVGLLDAAEGLLRTHGVTGQQRDQDGLHHYHGDVLSHTGARPAAEGLEKTVGHLHDGRRLRLKDLVLVFVFF